MHQLEPKHTLHASRAGHVPRAAVARGRRPAFTIVELLIVVAVIIILLSILIIGLNAARGTAQSANTIALMQSIRQGLVQFEEDVGYLPPVLDEQRRLVEGPAPGASYETDMRSWFSATTIAEYLLGYGHGREDGYGYRPASLPGGPLFDDEQPPTGIRHPGSDGVWSAGPGGALDARDPVNDGRVYGPYIEVKSERLLGILHRETDGTLRVILPGERFYAGFEQARDPKVILDYWGEPITYFRRPYPPGTLRQSYRAVDRDGDGDVDPVPTLSDFIRLRPYDLGGAGADALFADESGDVSTTYQLETGEFALQSTGRDRSINPVVRYDAPDDLNRDNILEVGP